MGTTITESQILDVIATAESEGPASIIDMLRFNFGVWRSSTDSLFSSSQVQALDVVKDWPGNNQPCYVGIDLATTNHSTSICVFFPNTSPKPCFFLLTYVSAHSEKSLREKSLKHGADYHDWAVQKHIIWHEDEIIDPLKVANDFKDLIYSKYRILGFCYDPSNSSVFIAILCNMLRLSQKKKERFLLPFPQKHEYYNPCYMLASLLFHKKRVSLQDSPIWSWTFENTGAHYRDGMVKPTKIGEDSPNDGSCAFLMSLGAAMSKGYMKDIADRLAIQGPVAVKKFFREEVDSASIIGASSVIQNNTNRIMRGALS